MAKCLSAYNAPSTKQNAWQRNNNDAPNNPPSDASELRKENVGYFYASNIEVNSSDPNNTLYKENVDYDPDVLPSTNSIDSENPYQNLCNGYTNGANAWSDAYNQIERLVLVQAQCLVHSNMPRSNVSSKAEISEGGTINVLTKLYKAINDEIYQRKLSIGSIQASFLKNELVELSSYKSLFDKLDQISTDNKSSIHTKLDPITGLYISADNVTLAQFDTSLSSLVSADNNTKVLYDNTNALRNDCICYSDCNAYYVCYCYGNCYYY